MSLVESHVEQVEAVHRALERITFGPAFPLSRSPRLFIEGISFTSDGRVMTVNKGTLHQLNAEHLTIRFTYNAPERMSGELVHVTAEDLTVALYVLFDKCGIKEAFLSELVHRMLERAVLHELDEGFMVDGVLVYDPHKGERP